MGKRDDLITLYASELREKCGVTPDDDIVLVGDVVANGPDSQGVVQWARESGARSPA